jgi:hypothetical protein
MTRIKVRTPTGGEYSFYTLEEFVSAIERGRIKADWQVFHTTAGRWLPVTAHPAFSHANAPRASGGEPPRRSSELVLIYPDPTRRDPTNESADPASAPTESPPMLAAEEIERALGRRYSQPNSTAGDRAWSTAVRRPSGPRSPLVPVHPPAHSRSALALVLERVFILGIILVLIAVAINAARNQRRHAEVDARSGQADRQAPAAR